MQKTKIILIKNLLFPVAGLAVFFTVWAIAAAALGVPLFLPGPWTTFIAALKLLSTGDFWMRMGFSFGVSVASFAVSFVLALALSLLSILFGLKSAFSPLLTIIRSVPIAAVMTLIWFWTGARITPMIVGALIVLPVLYASFFVTLSSADRDLLGTARVFGCGRAGLVRFVYLPLLRHSLIESSASGLSLTLKVVISAEIVVSTVNSMGGLIDARSSPDATGHLAATLLVAFFCILIEFLVRLPLRLIDSRE